MGIRQDAQGKNVYISGGSSGIGLAAGEVFSALGANVLVFSIDSKEQQKVALESLRKRATSEQQRFEALTLNVTDRDEVLRVLGEACQRFGAPWALINSAGMGGAVLFEQEPIERFDKAMQLNVYGLRHAVEACLETMKPHGGYIVNVASMAGLIGNFGYTTYSASKFAAVGFSQALRAELKPLGIQVSVLCPTQVDTPMLAHTDQFKPPESKAINDKAGLMTAEAVVEGMLDGMDKNKGIIIPGFKGSFVYLLSRVLPGLRESMTDRIIAKVRRQRQHTDA